MSFSESMLPPATPAIKQNNVLASSSPAFATPAHPIRNRNDVVRRHPSAFNTTIEVENNGSSAQPLVQASRAVHVLPVSLPPATLRPIAFRIFTKKHNLTLTASALGFLATFVGKNCGKGWREEGLAELVLEEVARSWKKANGRMIVDTNDEEGAARLKTILKTLEASMSGGRIVGDARTGAAGLLSRQDSLLGLNEQSEFTRKDSSESFGMSGLNFEATTLEDGDIDEGAETKSEARQWLKVVGAFEQPRLNFNHVRKQFERSKLIASIFPSPMQKTELFRQRYHLMHQRLMRNESFQTSTVAKTSTADQTYQVTPIANLLGRSGSGHLLLGLLSVSPAGALALSDLTGSIMLDLEQAMTFDNVDTWLCPGMLVLVDGIYEEEYNPAGGKLGNMSGIGGVLGGRFVGFSIGAPRCETRAQTLGISIANSTDTLVGGGFGWVDFLGVGSERALGRKMQKLEQQLLQNSTMNPARSKIVMFGNVTLDDTRTLLSLRLILKQYSEASHEELPIAFVLMGSFISHAAMSSPANQQTATSADKDTTSIAYKEHFDALAAILSDFPTLLRNCTFVFVPGDNDPWPSAATAGAATAIPRNPIPEMFTLRIRRAFATANSDRGSTDDQSLAGEAIWTSNPSRLTLFGSRQELVFFRDDISGRLRRTAIRLKQREAGIESNPQTTDGQADAMDVDVQHIKHLDSSSATDSARRLTKTLLDQSHLSPFPLAVRPVQWSYAHALSLYPLPSALVLCDTDSEPFALVYQGCSVVNTGKFITAAGSGGGKTRATWIEYDSASRRGLVKENVA